MARLALGGVADREGEPGDGGGVERARTQPALLSSAVGQRHWRLGTPGGEDAHPEGAADLVAGDDAEVDLAQVQRQLAERLDRVGVDRYAVSACDRGQVGERLDRADLVVGPHDAHQGGGVGAAVGLERGGEGISCDQAIGVGLDPGDPGALVGHEVLDRVEDGVVLDP